MILVNNRPRLDQVKFGDDELRKLIPDLVTRLEQINNSQKQFGSKEEHRSKNTQQNRCSTDLIQVRLN